VNDLARAELRLKLECVTAPDPLDLFTETKIQAASPEGAVHDLFTGHVVSAALEGDAIELLLMSGPSLVEKNPSPRWVHGVGAAETIYTIVREAGFPHEKTQIDGIENLAAEPMLVVVPIEGLTTDEPLTIGAVTFVGGREAIEPYRDRGVPELVYGPLVATPVHAVYSTTSALLRDAEAEGLHAIDVALGYLQLTAAYGLLRRPDGELQRFRRDGLRARPRRGEVVAVEGLGSGRCWVRVPGDRTPPLTMSPPQSATLPFGHDPTVAERQALIAWRRAVSEPDPVAQATALSDALEFYAAGVAAPALFSEEEINALLTAIPDLETNKKSVVRETIKRLNQSPLKRRVIEAASRDGVPLTPPEVDFLWKRIRSARNKAVHGKGAETPTLHEIERALSLVGRLLVYRLAKPPPAP
jgi:hypothetical protein